MGYRIGAMAGDSSKNTYTHKNFVLLKFSFTQGLEQMLPG